MLLAGSFVLAVMLKGLSGVRGSRNVFSSLLMMMKARIMTGG